MKKISSYIWKSLNEQYAGGFVSPYTGHTLKNLPIRWKQKKLHNLLTARLRFSKNRVLHQQGRQDDIHLLAGSITKR